MTALTVRGACAALGVPLGSSHVEVRNAYRQILLTAHPDKGGDPDVFMLARKAWQVLQNTTVARGTEGRSRCQAQARKRSNPNSNSIPVVKTVRQSKSRVAAPQSSSTHRLSSLLVESEGQPKRRLDRMRRSREDDFLEHWKRDALAVAKEGLGTSASSAASASTQRPREEKEVRSQPIQASATCPNARQHEERPRTRKASAALHGSCSSADLPASKRHAPLSRRPSHQRGVRRTAADSCSGASEASVALAAALARHVQIEAARARSADKARPMLERHLQAEAVARQSAATAVPHLDIEAVATKIRATPREERRLRLQELPKATRAALEQHMVAEKAAADASSICSTSVGVTVDGSSELDLSHCSGSIGNSSFGQA